MNHEYDPALFAPMARWRTSAAQRLDLKAAMVEACREAACQLIDEHAWSTVAPACFAAVARAAEDLGLDLHHSNCREEFFDMLGMVLRVAALRAGHLRVLVIGGEGGSLRLTAGRHCLVMAPCNGDVGPLRISWPAAAAIGAVCRSYASSTDSGAAVGEWRLGRRYHAIVCAPTGGAPLELFLGIQEEVAGRSSGIWLHKSRAALLGEYLGYWHTRADG